MKTLNIFYEGDLVGKFSQNEKMIHSFQYNQKWILNEHAFPISISMPLGENQFDNKTTLAFFENLLPEGNVRALLARWHHSDGVFSTLAKYGEDCAGALVVTSRSAPPKAKGRSSRVELKISEIDLAIDEREGVVDLIADKQPGYLSIAGAQDKFPCIFSDGKIYLPKGGAPTTHIVKTPIRVKGIKESVFNEYFCMKLAASIGFDVPEVQILEGKHPLLVVQRYDRQLDGNVIKRIHQQDFCQALGILSSEKYEIDGGPSFAQIFQLMNEHISGNKKIENSFRMLDWICFNLLIGNNDSHAKNISLLLNNRKYSLAPFYDLISTAIYPNLDTRFSFKIGGENAFSNIGRKEFRKEEKKIGIKEGTFDERMLLVFKKIVNEQDAVLRVISKEFPKAKIHDRIHELIIKRAKHFKKQGIPLE
ncbi:MAG TPA: type II toxin-antitoxin system HipA family toxin [Pseudobdellovibrionaceae bacterium]|nr:type II toxin-antitoxin system HipA family toxin [Pseudobdellovibrionaceae bacterium]